MKSKTLNIIFIILVLFIVKIAIADQLINDDDVVIDEIVWSSH